MNDDVAAELHRLAQAISKQNELQEEANGIMRGMVEALQATAQEIADLRADLPGYQEKRDAEARAAREAEAGIYATPAAPTQR